MENEKEIVGSHPDLKFSLELFKLEELEARLEMSDFANPIPPKSAEDGW
jgi:hypothetical protein